MKYYDLLANAYYDGLLDPAAAKSFEEMETERLFGIKDTGDRVVKKTYTNEDIFEYEPEPARTEPPKRNQPYYSGNTPGYQLYGQPVQLAADMSGGDQYAFLPGGRGGSNATVPPVTRNRPGDFRNNDNLSKNRNGGNDVGPYQVTPDGTVKINPSNRKTTPKSEDLLNSDDPAMRALGQELAEAEAAVAAAEAALANQEKKCRNMYGTMSQQMDCKQEVERLKKEVKTAKGNHAVVVGKVAQAQGKGRLK